MHKVNIMNKEKRSNKRARSDETAKSIIRPVTLAMKTSRNTDWKRAFDPTMVVSDFDHRKFQPSSQLMSCDYEDVEVPGLYSPPTECRFTKSNLQTKRRGSDTMFLGVVYPAPSKLFLPTL
jgi:hypothetical protein